MFEKPLAVEIYDLVDALHSCKQALGKSMSAHVLEMKGYMDQLHGIGKSYDNDMTINLINRSLNKDFGDFVRNFNMHCVRKTVTELHALLIDYEKGLKDKAPTPQVLTIQNGRENKPKPQVNKKDKSKGKTNKNKKVVPYQPKPKHNSLKRKKNPNKDQTCHHCHDLSRIRGNRGSASKSTTTNSAGKWNFPTFTKTSSAAPIGQEIDRSASSRVIKVGVSSGRESLFHTDNGMKFMLAPRSDKAKHSSIPEKSHGMRNLSGSPSFSGNFLRRTAKQCSFNGVLASSNSLSLLVNKLLMVEAKFWHENKSICWELYFELIRQNMNETRWKQKGPKL
uniref:Zinc finger, CCHC-type n=1 Tax=Tanacetum cinerariifolium TaxID=118510 RepID=A0A699J435_TANCI|nr:hypothetical protein [Tanacetum cinerariifolium]